MAADPAQEGPATGSAPAAESLSAPLPEPVRVRVVSLAAEGLGSLSAEEVPASLRAFSRWQPAKRVRLAATPIAAALERDPQFRRRIAAHVHEGLPDVAVAVQHGQAPPAADPLDVAAVAYLTRPAGWTRLVVDASEEIRHSTSAAESAEALQALTRLQEQLAAVRVQGRRDLEQLREETARLRREAADLRRQLRDALASAAAAEDQAAQQRAEAERLRTEVTTVVTDAEVELRRLRARTADAESALEAARRVAREGRSLEDTRVRLLLDTVAEAAQGLRRELALAPSELRPADTVRARSSGGLGPAALSGRALAEDDPAVLDQLLALPQAHLVVDGYNVTKAGFANLSLEEQRRRVLAGLAVIAAQSGAEVTCCFDGALLDATVPAAGMRGVRVLFSDPGVTADELIRRLVAAEPRGRPVTVVSSDREVADGVRRSGAHPVPAAALVRRLGRA
jgi:predicted RNA-binding protein with PIN domain/regulator of replication initiation timing